MSEELAALVDGHRELDAGYARLLAALDRVDRIERTQTAKTAAVFAEVDANLKQLMEVKP